MQVVSDEFLGMLRIAHLVAVEAVIEPPDDDPVTVPVIAGQVQLDRTAAVRRTGSLTVPWTLAHKPGDPLRLRELPYGGYAVLRRGIRFGDGSIELVTLGRLRIDSVSSRLTEAAATLELSDRMAQVIDEPLLGPYTPTGKATDAIVELVEQVFADTIGYTVLTDPASEPNIVDATYTGNRQEAISNLAATIAAEVFFDAEGDLVVQPQAVPAAPVWTVDAGTTGVLVDADESLDRTATVNGVQVVGQASAGVSPVTALAIDDDPESPTRWGGPYGHVAVVVASTAIQTLAQAEALAAAELARRLTLHRSLAVTSVPNPALEPGDTIRVVFGDGRMEDHLIDSLTVGLEASASVQLATRSVTTPAAA